MLVPLLGSPAKEAVLLYVLTHGEAYPSEMAAAFGRALVVVQNQLSGLEDGGVVVSRLRGKVRLHQLNPRYPFRKEVGRLLRRAGVLAGGRARAAAYSASETASSRQAGPACRKPLVFPNPKSKTLVCVI